MQCPGCQNKDFIPTKDFQKPIRNIGGKENFKTFSVRRYICLQCGVSFKTKETFYMKIEIKRNQQELFGDGHK